MERPKKYLTKFFFSQLLGVVVVATFFCRQIPTVFATNFTAGAVIRDGPGPFSAAPVIQGSWDSSGTNDIVTYSSGSTIYGGFKQNFDALQGSVVFWITPEWDGNDGKRHSIFYASTATFLLFKSSDNTLRVQYQDNVNHYWQSAEISISDWVAGSTYFVVVSWDHKNTFDSTNYFRFSVNDQQSYTGTVQGWLAGVPMSTIHVGGSDSDLYPANAIIEGLTVYRRPLFDGVEGIDVGNGDEINQIYNGSTASSKDPTLITGSWDVVFALPTNSSTGTLPTTGQAWTHPHSSNLLPGNSNKGGFMIDGTYTNDGWVAEPVSGTLTLQPDGTEGVDSYTYEYEPDYSSAIGTTMTVNTHSGYNTHPLIKFDVSSIPSGATIDSATLSTTMTYKDSGEKSINWYSVLSANDGWVEGASWNYANPSSQRWAGDTGNDGGTDAGCSVSGTDYNSTAMGTTTFLTDDVAGQERDASLTTSYVADWVSGNNYGLVGVSTSEQVNIASSDHATSTYRPKLVVNYTALPTVAALDTSEKIFSGGYKTTSTAANQGIYDEISVTAGDDFVVRAIANSDGTSIPKVLITGADDGEITSLTGTNTSTRTDPDVLLFTFEADTTENIKVKLINTQSSGITYWHQIEVLSNSFTNPSLETGSGDPWVPTGWVNYGVLEAGESSQESTAGNLHSGTYSMKYNNTDLNDRLIYITSLGISSTSWVDFGFWVKPDTITTFKVDTNPDLVRQDTGTRYNLQDVTVTADVWNNWRQVLRWTGYDDDLSVATSGTDDTLYWDDFYLFPLTDVTLTVTPASEVNSTENTDEIRVDGRDSYVETGASSITTTSGYMSFDWRPRHSAANAVKFAETTADDAYVLYLYGDSNDYVKVFWDSANTLKMAYNMNGAGETSGTWNATGAVSANSQYNIILSYTGGGNMVLSVGGADRITLSSIPASFGTAPNNVYFGSYFDGSNATLQGDATFSEIVFDNTAPSVSLTALSPDPNSDTTPSIIGTATEAVGTITAVQYQMDGTGGSWNACTADDGTMDEASEAFTCTVSPALTDGSHTIYVRATDSNGNTTAGGAESTDSFTIDATAPTPTSVAALTTNEGATITWSTTEVSSSKVDYGLSNSYGSSTLETDTSPRVTNHSVSISSLVSCTTYHYRVRSKDALSNEGLSSDNTFTTTGCSGDSTVVAETSQAVTTASGGTVSLDDSTGGGAVSLTVPAGYTDTDTTLQVKQLSTTEVVASLSVPAADQAVVGSKTYHLSALSDTSSAVSTFNQAITISMTYAEADIRGLKENTLTIYRYNTSSSAWEALNNCSLNPSSRLVTCTTTQFSTFALFAQKVDDPVTSYSTQTNPSPPGCIDASPGGKTPWLYAATAQSSTSIKLYFTQADDPVDHYALEFGTKSGEYQYSATNIGPKDITSYTVYYLSPNTTYYFRLRAGNGCATGAWSNELSFSTKPTIVLDELQIVSTEIKPVKKEETKKTATADLEEGKVTPTPKQEEVLGIYEVNVKVLDEQQQPVSGAEVTLHSKVQKATTNDQGIANFKNVEPGDHKLLIAYQNYEGEQSLNLSGDVKEFNVNVQVKVKNNIFSPISVGIIGILLTIIVFQVLKQRRDKKKLSA